MNLLHLAAEMGMERLAARLLKLPQGPGYALQQAGGSMEGRSMEGRLPIHFAAEHRCNSIVEMLLPFSQLAQGTSVEELIEDATMDYGDEYAPPPPPPTTTTKTQKCLPPHPPVLSSSHLSISSSPSLPGPPTFPCRRCLIHARTAGQFST